MKFTNIPREIYIVILAIGMILFLYNIVKKAILPWLINKTTKEIEINPKWVMSKLQNKYYGFHDIDIIVVDGLFGVIPRFRLSKKDKNRLQLLIPEDTSVNDIEDVAHLALAGKLKIKYGIWYPDKSPQWLSILNYMLDGGDIKIEATKWESTEDNKPIDLS